MTAAEKILKKALIIKFTLHFCDSEICTIITTMLIELSKENRKNGFGLADFINLVVLDDVE